MYEYRGIRGLVAAELIKDTKTELEYGTPFFIAGTAQLTKETESSSEPHFYDNRPAILVDASGADKINCSTSVIPPNVLAELTGQHYDEETGVFVEGKPQSKYFAIGYITSDTSGRDRYVWRLKVKCAIPSEEHNTKDDGTDANGQELEFTGIETDHEFLETDDTAKAVVYESEKELFTEEEFFEKVQTVDTIKDKAKNQEKPNENMDQ